MPPEQILGMPIDGRADLYALGCVGWWLLAGGEVFSRKGGEAKVLHRHMYEQPPVLQAMTRTWLPDELEDVIRAMLAKDANQRPVDARELSRALRAIPIPEEYAWTTERAQSWWRAYTPPAPQEPLPSAEIQMIVPRDSVPHIKQSDEPKVATISNPVARTKLDMSIQPPPPPPRRRR
jgi:serine/threonine-protein kinase